MKETAEQLRNAIEAIVNSKVKSFTDAANLRLLRRRLKTAEGREAREAAARGGR